MRRVSNVHAIRSCEREMSLIRWMQKFLTIVLYKTDDHHQHAMAEQHESDLFLPSCT
jgi:hypothetical protein